MLTSLPSVSSELIKLTGGVHIDLRKNEELRKYVLRGIAVAIGCSLVVLTDFNILEILRQTNFGKSVFDPTGIAAPYANIAIGGIAAAAGSSYWHDQLDKVRKLKSATQSIRTIARGT